MLSIFATPKVFEGEFNIIQRNAIKSWTLLNPRPEVILFGDEKGTAGIAEEFNIKHFPKIARNEFGTPLIGGIFQEAQRIAKNNILVYVNADIILINDFTEAIKEIKNEKSFLMVGQRWDVDIKKIINCKDLNWQAELQKKVLEKGKLHPETGMDYFVFPKGFYENVPPFALGRTVWDEWIFYEAWRKKAKIINATKVITAVHQSHSYRNKTKKETKKGKEAKRNLRLAGGYGHCFTIKDATHILTSNGLKKAPKMSFIRRLEIIPYLGFFIRQTNKIFNLFHNEP